MGIKRVFERRAFIYVSLSIIVFSISMAAAILLHPGFNLFDPNSSLSELGEVGDPLGWVFNVGVILTGIFLLMFSVSMMLIYRARTSKYYSMMVLFIASVFYVGFGVFPYGTPYHTPLAKSFFFVASVAIFHWSAVSIHEGEWKMATLMVLLTISSYVIYGMYTVVGFPFVELYAGIVLGIWSVYAGLVDAKRYYMKKYSSGDN